MGKRKEHVDNAASPKKSWSSERMSDRPLRDFRFLYLWILLSALISSCLTVALAAVFFNFPVVISFMTTNTPTITQTYTPTLTLTPSLTSTPSPTFTITLSPTATATFTPTLTPSLTFTPTDTLTPAPTLTPSPTFTRTPTMTPTPTHSYTLQQVDQDTIIYLGPTMTSMSLFTVPKDETLYVTSTERGCWVFVTYQPSSGGGSISGWITMESLGEDCQP